MPEIEDIPRRYMKVVRREHSGLMAETKTTGIWPFKRDRLFVVCNCGWYPPKEIPLLPIEAQHISRYIARNEMESHIVRSAIRLGWKPRS